MPSAEMVELLGYLDRLIQATRGGKIEWDRPNPTTFVWNTSATPPPGAIVLQRVERRIVRQGQPVTVTDYLLQVMDPSRPTPRVSMEGDKDEQVNAKLKELYEAITTAIARKGLDFFKTIISKQA